MISGKRIAVIIPAFNEEESLPHVLADIPDFVDEIIVANNGSTDNTIEIAKKAGVTVVNEDEKGYGAACLKAIEEIKNKNFDIVVFLDGDYSDYPEEMNFVVDPIIKDDCDLVIGSRMIGTERRRSYAATGNFWQLACLISD